MSQHKSSSVTPAASTSSAAPRQRPLVQAIGLAISLSVAAAQAATITVNTADDTLTGMCRLRDAVQAANTDSVVQGCVAGSGTDTIDLSAIAGQTITLNANFPSITTALSIEGAGVTLDGNHTYFGPVVTGAITASINQMTITEAAVGVNNEALRVLTGAHLTLSNSTLQSNTTTGFGGAIEVQDSTLVINNSSILGNSAAVAAAIGLFDSTLVLNDSVVSGNRGSSAPGGIEVRGASTATINNSLLTHNNVAVRAYSVGSQVVLRNSTLTGNTGTYGSAVNAWDGTVTMINSTMHSNQGRGLHLSTVSASAHLVNSILSNSGNNDCSRGSGTVTAAGVNLVRYHNCNLNPANVIEGTDPLLSPLQDNGGPTLSFLPLAGSPVIEAGDNSEVPIDLEFDQRGENFPRIAGNFLNVKVDLGSIEVQPNQTGPDFLVNSADDVDDGFCREGSGHCSLREALNAANSNPDASTVIIDNTLVFQGNSITLGGSRLPEVTTPVVIQGWGMTVDGDGLSGILGATNAPLSVHDMHLTRGKDAVAGGAIVLTGTATLELHDSTLSGNSALFGGGISGGASVLLVNSTVTGNTAGNSGSGLWNGAGSIEVVQSTIANNSSPSGALYAFGGSVTLTNSILAGSSTDCSGNSVFTTTGVNLVQNKGTCALVSGADLIEGIDAQLGSLAANGGIIPTLLPMVGSPVLNVGDNAQVPGGLVYDQRGKGFDRIFAGTVDLGAVELQIDPQAGPNFVVNSLDDVDDGSCDIAPNHCSLREALNAANSNADASTISFDSSLLMPAGTITLSGSRLPVATAPVVIEGGGTTVDANQMSGVMGADGTSLAVHQMHLTGGVDSIAGGAILLTSLASLELHDSTLSGNSAGFGGGISGGATVQLVNSTVTGNTAQTAGGGVWNSGAVTELVHSTFTGNTSTGGGALSSFDGTVTLTNSILSGSVGSADCDGNSVFNLAGRNLVQTLGNCALYTGPDLTFGVSPMLGTLADNGGLTPTMLPMLGSPVLNIGDNAAIPVGLDFDQRGPGFARIFAGTVDLGAAELQSNPQTGFNLVVNSLDDVDDGSCDIAPDHCSLREAINAANADPDASEITFDASLLSPAGTVTLTGALPTVTTNISIFAEGTTVDADQKDRVFSVARPAKSVVSTLALDRIHLTNGLAADGGLVSLGPDTELVLMDSTLSGSTATNLGGAIYASAERYNRAVVTMTNSTISGNTAGYRGSVSWTSYADLDISHSTIVDNPEPPAESILYFAYGTVNLTNSIIANDAFYELDSSVSYVNYLGVNFVSSDSAVFQQTDPSLGPLADNGGPTPTHAPLFGSPVIDAGDNSVIPVDLDFDQRGTGFPRVFGPNVDIGSFEVQSVLDGLIFQNSFEDPPETN